MELSIIDFMVNNNKRRQWLDAPTIRRCNALIRLKDGTEAQCGKSRKEDAHTNLVAPTTLCTQHLNMFCGGKDIIDFRFKVSMRSLIIPSAAVGGIADPA